MEFHNIYGYGQLFCFSGLDGETCYEDDFTGMLMDEPIKIRFHFKPTLTLSIPLKEGDCFNGIAGDFLDGKGFFISFKDSHTIVGKTIYEPRIEDEKGIEIKEDYFEINEKQFYMLKEKKKEYFYFTFSYKEKGNILTNAELDNIKSNRYSYYLSKIKCKDKRFEKLYTKCLSVNRENVYSKEGKIPCRWTTPDRIPHRHMWLWDSVFHSLAFLSYDEEMAKESIYAVLCLEEEDGFIPHMLNPNGAISNITQPQVLCWGVWNIYKKTKDKEFLLRCAPYLKKFILWTTKNRDKNKNKLLEWYTDPNDKTCKCGESGLDNSPRFDFDEELDAVDFSTYLCNDSYYLSLIFKELGNKEDSLFFLSLHQEIKGKINELLWCEEDGIYYDRRIGGDLTRVSSSASFLPMFAGIPSNDQMEKMVRVLTDEEKYWTEFPIPSIPRDSVYYDTDMWRGCSWLNINYFVILGLRKYGYYDIAKGIRERTIKGIEKWYKATGNIFEFYDADNKTSPLFLKRKGEQPNKPDYLKHVHAITDFNWTACFIELLINKIYY